MLRPNLYIYLFVYESRGPVTWSIVSHLGCKSALRRLPRVLRPRATWAQVWREILNPREVHAKKKNKDGFPFR